MDTEYVMKLKYILLVQEGKGGWVGLSWGGGDCYVTACNNGGWKYVECKFMTENDVSYEMSCLGHK